jgi:hypothetical protein
MGQPGLEPGTNPESFRGCFYWCSSGRDFNAKIASLGFFLRFNANSSFRAAYGTAQDAMSSMRFPNRRVM